MARTGGSCSARNNAVAATPPRNDLRFSQEFFMWTLFLENVLQSKFDDSSIGRRRNPAVASRRVRIGSGRAEIRTIERIEQLRTELHTVGLPYASPSLLDSGSHLKRAWRLQLPFGSGRTSELPRLIGNKRGAVKVLRDPLGPRPAIIAAWIFHTVRPVGLSAQRPVLRRRELQRRSGIHGPDSVDLPPVHQRLGKTVAPSRRQLIDPRCDKRVGTVEVGRASFRTPVAGVLNSSVVGKYSVQIC